MGYFEDTQMYAGTPSPIPERIDEIPQFLEAYFVVLSGPIAGQTIPLNRAICVLGRDAQAEVRIQDKAVSRIHAIVTYQQQEFRICGRGRNGTFLNGSRVTGYRLRDGDKVLVGQSLLLFRVNVVDRLRW
jgi:pSer/pThr/pTyr-binding forkhead associated (FHA) protein